MMTRGESFRRIIKEESHLCRQKEELYILGVVKPGTTLNFVVSF